MLRWTFALGVVVAIAALLRPDPWRPDFDRAFASFTCQGVMCKDAKSIYSRKSAAWVARVAEDMQ